MPWPMGRSLFVRVFTEIATSQRLGLVGRHVLPPSAMVWATSEQLEWLNERVPQWRKIRCDKGKTSEWLIATTSEFRGAFAIAGPDLSKLPDVSPHTTASPHRCLPPFERPLT